MSTVLSVLSTILYSVIIPVLALGLLILVHEIGHYCAARATGIGVREFAIGMGPKIFSFTRNRIVYSLRAIPIGGFVNMIGEDEESDAYNSLNKKPIWKRFIALVSGSFMNLLLGFILMSIIVSGLRAFNSTEILRFGSGSLSETTGTPTRLQVGDEIIKVNDKKINIYHDLVYAVIRYGAEPVDITVKRNGQTEKIQGVRFPVEKDNGITYGIIDFRMKEEAKTLATSSKQAFYQSLFTIDMVWSSFFDLITGKYSMNEVSGPVGITQEIGKSAKDAVEKKEGGTNFLFLLTLITMNLGIVNLLPLPALDGGRLVFLLIELVRRKPIKPEYEGYVHLAGMVLLLLFMVVITYKDIMTIFVK